MRRTQAGRQGALRERSSGERPSTPSNRLPPRSTSSSAPSTSILSTVGAGNWQSISRSIVVMCALRRRRRADPDSLPTAHCPPKPSVRSSTSPAWSPSASIRQSTRSRQPVQLEVLPQSPERRRIRLECDDSLRHPGSMHAEQSDRRADIPYDIVRLQQEEKGRQRSRFASELHRSIILSSIPTPELVDRRIAKRGNRTHRGHGRRVRA